MRDGAVGVGTFEVKTEGRVVRGYRYTPASWYADPMADEEALSKPPLSLEVNYYIQQQLDSGANGYCQEEQ